MTGCITINWLAKGGVFLRQSGDVVLIRSTHVAKNVNVLRLFPTIHVVINPGTCLQPTQDWQSLKTSCVFYFMFIFSYVRQQS